MKKRLKAVIKYAAGKWFGAKDSKIESLISQAGLVSFDIFDTLVKRNIWEPEHIHKLVAEEFFKETGIRLHGYPQRRVDAEKRARECSGKEEISLEEIFRCLDGMPESQKEMLKQIEERTEVSICCPNMRIKRLYEQAVKDKKCIVITSDMYLDEVIVREILTKCGYEIFEKLYLSSSYNMCKSTGNIYEAIKMDFPEFSGRILHIGDNFKSDYLKAKRKGIRGCLIDGRQENLRYWKKSGKKDFDYERLYCFLNNHIDSKDSDAAVIGYEILGPMLLGYCKWLKERIECGGIKKVFFLSREGKILQEAFNTLYPDNDIVQCYLYVSRQSLTVPLIADAVSFDEMVNRIKCFFHVPLLRTIRVVCSLDQEEFCRALSEIGLQEDTEIYKVPAGKREMLFLIIQKLGGKHFMQQKVFVAEYLNEIGFEGKVAIADIGWEGTMQKALGKYVPDAQISGFYFGVRNLSDIVSNEDVQRNGYIFETGKKINFDLMIRFTTEIYELLFLHKEGSVQAYSKEKGKIVPKFADAEYGDEEGRFIGTVQRTALKFLGEVRRNIEFRDSIKTEPESVMKAYAEFAAYPKMSTIHIFDKFKVLDGSVKKLVPEHSLFYYCFHIDELKKDLNNSRCKIFFLKKLLKINLPYFKFLSFLAVKMNIKSDYRKRFYS